MISFADAADSFLDHLRGLNRSEHTITAYRSDLEQFGQFLEKCDRTLSDLSSNDVSGWMTALAGLGRSGATRNRKFHALVSFFGYLVATKRIEQNPTAGLEPPTIEKKEPRVLSKTEVKALQGVSRDDPRDHAIIQVFLQTGIRISELVNLTLDDVTWSEPDTIAHLCIRQGKGKKDRLIPLNSVAERAVKRYIKIRPQNEYRELFLSKKGKLPLHAADVRLMLHKYYRKAGIKGASAHTLRHTFCTLHAAQGTNIIVIQRAAGHVSLTTTQRYLHLVERMMEDELEKHAL